MDTTASLAVRTASLALSLLVIAACSKDAPAPAARPPVDVTTMVVTPADTPVGFEFVGQTQSSREVEIRARVDGFLDKRTYTEGDSVRQNQPLFQMDRKPFEAALQSARGQLAQQQAALDVAVANLARIRPLADQNALSKKDLDDAVGNERSAQAAVLAAQGQVRTAELNLGYTTIVSPLAGKSGAARQQEGSYLSAANNLLTTVSQVDPMWVNFSISENEILRFRDLNARGVIVLPKDDDFLVTIILADGSVFPNKGHISFADPSFSKDTGTFLVRSVFANPGGTELRPGQFVKVIVEGSTRPKAILVPQRAVQQGPKSHFVWVVNKEGKAEERVVDVGEWHGDDWFINQGLRAGDQVVVDGAIRVSQGASLKTTPVAAKQPSSTPDAVPAPIASTRIYFASGSRNLSADSEATLGPLAQYLVAQPTATVEITGYVDGTGSPAANERLAKLRAHATFTALRKRGVAAAQVTLKPPAAIVGGADDEQARRVDVRVVSAPPPGRRIAAQATSAEKDAPAAATAK